MLKTCKWCLEEKPIQEFNRHSKTRDGHLNKCKKCEKEYKALYYARNKNGIIKEQKNRNKENYKLAKRTEKYKEVRNKSRKNRYKNDTQYKLSCVLRSRLKMALKGKSKGTKTLETIGCSVQQLIKHLESQFVPGMTWKNYGKYWHIDHIRPISSFDLPSEISLANHYSNLQPLWAEDNFKKGSKYGIS